MWVNSLLAKWSEMSTIALPGSPGPADTFLASSEQSAVPLRIPTNEQTATTASDLRTFRLTSWRDSNPGEAISAGANVILPARQPFHYHLRRLTSSLSQKEGRKEGEKEGRKERKKEVSSFPPLL